MRKTFVKLALKQFAGIADALPNCMTHKQHAMTLDKTWPQTGTFKSHLREIVANLKRLVAIPVGYQDETGFHYGTEPASRQAKSHSA
jgi:hypothetical protein